MSKKKPHRQQAPIQPTERVAQPRRSGAGRWLNKMRLLGVGLVALGLYLASDEPARIARTGHGGRKSAVIPLIVCMGIAYAIDPDFRRMAIFNTMAVAGVVGGVVWFVLWD